MALERMFVTYPEAVAELGGDRETIRQAFFQRRLRAFIELHDAPATTPALPPDVGDATVVTQDIHSYARDGQGFTTASRWFRDMEDEGRDGFAFHLSGWFMVDEISAEWWLTRGRLTSPPFVWPASAPPIPYAPPVELKKWMKLTEPGAFSEEYSYERQVWLAKAQIDDLVRGATDKPAAEGQKPLRIRADREEVLLRTIAGLWELSNLPREPNTTADKLSALFDGWNWEKPSKKTLADTVLSVASKLPRNKHS